MRKQLFLAIFIMSLCVQAFAEPPVYRVTVDGLACPFCVYGIKKKLNQIEGIKNIEADLKKGEFTIYMHNDKTLTEPMIRELVNDSGFTLRSFNEIDSKTSP